MEKLPNQDIVDGLLLLVNHHVSLLWIYFLIGSVYAAILEWKLFVDLYKKSKNGKKISIKNLIPFLKRLSYVIGGTFLSLGGYIIVFLVSDYYGGFDEGYSEKSNYYTMLTGVLAVIGFLFAGTALTLSAGGRWMVNLSKLICTVTMLSLFIIIVLNVARLLG